MTVPKTLTYWLVKRASAVGLNWYLRELEVGSAWTTRLGACRFTSRAIAGHWARTCGGVVVAVRVREVARPFRVGDILEGVEDGKAERIELRFMSNSMVVARRVDASNRPVSGDSCWSLACRDWKRVGTVSR